MNVFVFDIETIPDVHSGRRVYGVEDLDDEGVADVMFHKVRESSGRDFLRHHLHRIVAISVVLRASDKFKVWSLGTPKSSEAELIERFFAGLERYSPRLVSWNGGGFDLPVLHYRSMLQGVCAAKYWETGETDNQFRSNNYMNRYHHRHTDLMDVLSGYQPRAVAPLHEIATMLGFPGKLGMDGSAVWDRFLDGDIVGIRNYCEIDVLNTYLIYLRYELIRGRMTEKDYGEACWQVRSSLARDSAPHLNAFLTAWND